MAPRKAAAKKAAKRSAEPVFGFPDLPHNMGRAKTSQAVVTKAQQTSPQENKQPKEPVFGFANLPHNLGPVKTSQAIATAQQISSQETSNDETTDLKTEAESTIVGLGDIKQSAPEYSQGNIPETTTNEIPSSTASTTRRTTRRTTRLQFKLSQSQPETPTATPIDIPSPTANTTRRITRIKIKQSALVQSQAEISTTTLADCSSSTAESSRRTTRLQMKEAAVVNEEVTRDADFEATEPQQHGKAEVVKEETAGSEDVDLQGVNQNIPELPKKRQRKAKAVKGEPTPKDDDAKDADFEVAEPPKKKQRKAKAAKDENAPPKKPRVLKKDLPLYHASVGVPWGESPFPDLYSPSPEACQLVYSLLTMQHGEAAQPDKIAPPSLEIAGCGEVPSTLDGTMRTLLSGSTTMANADKMVKGLIATFGTITRTMWNGQEHVTVVENMIDWNKVRLATYEEITAAIKVGGIGKTKAAYIKDILEWVYWENVERTEAFRKEKELGIPAISPGVERLTQSQKDMEIWMFDHDILSLDHLSALDPGHSMEEFIKYKGIGVKTAACVLLFNMQVPCFAVDTHVWRITKWLGWAPEKADRDKAFAHLDVYVPDELKYSLHQLFIRHGKTCRRCQAITNKATEGWDECLCPLERLLQRTGKDKIARPPKEKDEGKPKKAGARKPKKKVDDDGDVDMDAGSDNEDESAQADKNIEETGDAQESDDSQELLPANAQQLDPADAAEALLNPEVEAEDEVAQL